MWLGGPSSFFSIWREHLFEHLPRWTIDLPTPFDCLIAFGSNLGDEAAILLDTQQRLRELPGVESLVASDPLRTAPVGGPVGQPDYLNAVFRVQTTFVPVALHDALLQIEVDLGRERRVRWGARKLDLDLLLVDQIQLQTDRLTLPHPRMSFRRFVLQPARQIAGQMIHPVAELTIAELLDRLNRTPPEIIWVTPKNATAQKCRDEILELPVMTSSTATPWQIKLVDTLEEFVAASSTAKFVAWSLQRPVELATCRFQGPQLNLPSDPTKVVIELRAAISAMS